MGRGGGWGLGRFFGKMGEGLYLLFLAYRDDDRRSIRSIGPRRLNILFDCPSERRTNAVQYLYKYPSSSVAPRYLCRPNIGCQFDEYVRIDRLCSQTWSPSERVQLIPYQISI